MVKIIKKTMSKLTGNKKLKPGGNGCLIDSNSIASEPEAIRKTFQKYQKDLGNKIFRIESIIQEKPTRTVVIAKVPELRGLFSIPKRFCIPV